MADEEKDDTEKSSADAGEQPEGAGPFPQLEGLGATNVDAVNAEIERNAPQDPNPEANEEAETTADDAGEQPEGAADAGEKPAGVASILARVQNLEEEGALDKVAREEEEKLAERRASAKKKSKLEGSASKKLDKIGSKPKKKKTSGATSTSSDRAFNQAARAQDVGLTPQAISLGDWLMNHKRAVGMTLAAALIAGIGVFGYTSYKSSQNLKASRGLIAAVTDLEGVIGPAPKGDDAPPERRPRFETTQARDDAALEKVRQVSSQHKGTGAAILARLAEGSILLDRNDTDGAIAAFTEVQGSALAKVDNEVRGRAIESLGFAYEMKGDLDQAAKTYRELENTVEVRGFKELAIYHQARIAEAKGETDKAKELFQTVLKRVSDESERAPFPFLRSAVEDRLRVLDPSALPKPSPFNSGLSGMSEAQIREIQEQIKKMTEQAQKNTPGEGAPTEPPAP